MSRVVTALVLLMIVDVSILALPTGAPEAACKGMVPGHRGAAMFKGARSGTYTLSQPKNHFRKGEIMNVTLVTNSNAFRGFMVKALIRGGLDDNGQFLESEKVKPISICSAATQKTSDKKFAVILHWKVPENTTGEVRFHVVRNGVWHQENALSDRSDFANEVVLRDHAVWSVCAQDAEQRNFYNTCHSCGSLFKSLSWAPQ